ncbi:hypothetical protein SCUCBS95973_000939 [Sporothrix curviconia]|uniref:Uncharacterized protein n=1 Tax=Sporothrix curviconia TaxID=1260050 RepID=A0ABP0AUF5_9PEZI
MLLISLLFWTAAGAVAGPVGVRDVSATQPIPPPIGDDVQPLPPPQHPPLHGIPELPSVLSVTAPASASSGGNTITFTPRPSPTASMSTPRDLACTSTLEINLLTHILIVNVTKTIHPSTFVSTRYFDCHGCPNLAIHNIGGLGPVVQFVMTVTDTASPATVTDYRCSRSSAASVLETAVPPTTQSPSPPPALPTPRN